tara:strand:+ start:279 stop:848 length:570 start_codon:yes stop_codon:yes gene_type:complete
MSNSTQIAVINTLENEGKFLADEYKTRTAKADRIMFNFKKDTAADGFDTRLGKLMQSLRLEGGMRISTDRLRDCGIASIPKQRRSDAEWYVNTKAEADAFNKKAKKGFKNLSALRKAMAQAAKADEPKQPTESNDSDVKSDVGLDNNVVEVVDSASLALQLIADCEKHGIAIHEVLDILSPYNVQKAVA